MTWISWFFNACLSILTQTLSHLLYNISYLWLSRCVFVFNDLIRSLSKVNHLRQSFITFLSKKILWYLIHFERSRSLWKRYFDFHRFSKRNQQSKTFFENLWWWPVKWMYLLLTRKRVHLFFINDLGICRVICYSNIFFCIRVADNHNDFMAKLWFDSSIWQSFDFLPPDAFLF